MTIEEAIRILDPETSAEAIREHMEKAGSAGLETLMDAADEAIAVALDAMKRHIQKVVIMKEWSPSRCPRCEKELSESLGDGYYKHMVYLERCPDPECGQRLKW